MIKNILIDLDGTLTDPKVGITASARYGLEKVGHPIAENINIVMGGDNFIRKPFIEIQKYDPILADGIFSNLVEDEKILLDEKGFLEVDKIQLEY